MLGQIVIAAAGGVIVLAVQGGFILIQRQQRRINQGDLPVGKFYRAWRRFALIFHVRRVRRAITNAAKMQREKIEMEHNQDPLWKLDQTRLSRVATGSSGYAARATLKEALANARTARGIFVRGESGSGKSSMISRAAAMWADGQLALRFDLASYDGAKPLAEQLAHELLRPKDLERALALGQVVLLLDGFESLRTEEVRQSFDSGLESLLNRFHLLTFAVFSRPDSIATRSLLRAHEYQVTRLTIGDIEEALESLNADPAPFMAQVDDSIMTLITSPLALRMLFQTYSQTGQVPRNTSDLYRQFVGALLTDAKAGLGPATYLTGGAKLEILSTLSYSFANLTVSFERSTVLRKISPILVEMASQYVIPSSIDAREILDVFISDGILRMDNSAVRFVHQSVQEYLAAVALLQRVNSGEKDILFVCELATLAEWRTSVVFFAGLLGDASGLVETLRLKNRLLAAECMRAARHVSPSLVDKCIVEALYEFKFGETSFNYELVFALAMISDLRSPDLPERIIDEMDYWCRKYATKPLNVLSSVDTDSLMALIESGDPNVQISDAIWTLAVRGYIGVIPLLEKFLAKRVTPLDHVAALALGRLRQRRGVQLLLSTALDQSAPDPLRSACFNSVGMIGAKECLPAIIDFIRSEREIEGTVRENAAWALIGLEDSLFTNSADFHDLLIKQLDVGRSYARAMFAYLIGRFKVRAGADRLLEIASTPDVDYLFLEDIVFAIGELACDGAQDVLLGLLNHPDNVVRARAIEALAKIGCERSVITRFTEASESSDIVRDAARRALAAISPPPPNQSGDVSLDIRRRR